jgi:hypothetical protein
MLSAGSRVPKKLSEDKIMKQTIKFIVLGIVAAVIGFAAMCVAIKLDASDGVAIASYFGVAAIAAIALGVFRDGKDAARHTSIKDAARYGQAAIFIGSAAIFVGTPQECEDVCDDLWHRGVQCEVGNLTGEFDIL